MKWRSVILAAAICMIAAESRADSTIASAQQKLKDQGFYYGEVTGAKDADTSAAIRRYQIRNGLKITGELNDETAKSLGAKGRVAESTPTPAPPHVSATPRPIIRATPPPDNSDLRNEVPPAQSQPATRDFAPTVGGIFGGTPYQNASPLAQQRVLMNAQSLLARRGYYRGFIDGVYGPEMAFAIRAFQSRFRIAPSGRLDVDTLAAMGLLPGQPAPGVTTPRYRRYPRMVAPDGEPVYVPR